MARVFSAMLSSFANDSHESVKFSTGGGEKCSSQTIGLRDNSGFLSDANHFLFESCPLVRSSGLDFERVDLVLFGCRTHFHILSGILLSVTSHVMNRTSSMRQEFPTMFLSSKTNIL